MSFKLRAQIIIALIVIAVSSAFRREEFPEGENTIFSRLTRFLR